jgi:hypothetical protein
MLKNWTILLQYFVELAIEIIISGSYVVAFFIVVVVVRCTLFVLFLLILRVRVHIR